VKNRLGQSTYTYLSFLRGVNLPNLFECELNTLYNILSSKFEAFLRGFRLSNLQVNALILSTRKCFSAMKETTIITHSTSHSRVTCRLHPVGANKSHSQRQL